MKHIKHVLIIVNLKKKNSQQLLDEMSEYFSSICMPVRVFSFIDKPNLIPDFSDIDVIFSLGGDGTVLFTARACASLNLPIIPVNIGNIGFITEVGQDDWQTTFLSLCDKKQNISKRIMLRAEIQRGSEVILTEPCLNDFVISSRTRSSLIKLKLLLNHEKVGRYRADGIIIATPTGATGYSASAGGPILDPEMSAVIVNPICPYTLSNRPFVFPGDAQLRIEVEPEQVTKVSLTVDGQTAYDLLEGDVISVQLCKYKAHIVRSTKRNFYEVLRAKLNWSGGPDA